MNKKISVNLAVAIAVIAMTVTFSITMIVAMKMFDKTVASVREKEITYNKIAEIDKKVRAEYYGAINKEYLDDMIAAGYMAGLGDGKNSQYYTAKQYAEYLDVVNGKVVGIGVDVVKAANGYARVIRVYADSPAFTAGIEKGFVITKIGDIDTKTMTLDAITKALRGAQGTELTLTYLNFMNEEQPAVTLRRTPYEVGSVEYSIQEGKTTGYVKILTFNAKTASEVDAAVRDLQAKGATAIVFDVRNNANGVLENAIQTIDVLCGEGPIASVSDKDGNIRSIGISDSMQIDMPMVALVNAGTQGAAELFASSIRDFEKGKIVGVKTPGKGSIQCEPQRLSYGSAISYTIGKLLTGKGESFDTVGLVPDDEIALKAEEELIFYDLTPESDSQILRAIEVANSLVTKGIVSGTIEAPSSNVSSAASTPQGSSTPQSTAASGS